jgi:hypothetical protein
MYFFQFWRSELYLVKKKNLSKGNGCSALIVEAECCVSEERVAIEVEVDPKFI